MQLLEAKTIASEAVLRNGSYDPASADQQRRLEYAIMAAQEELFIRVKPLRETLATAVILAGTKSIAVTNIAAHRVYQVRFNITGQPTDQVATLIRHEDMLRIQRDGAWYPAFMPWLAGVNLNGLPTIASVDQMAGTVNIPYNAGQAINVIVTQWKRPTRWTPPGADALVLDVPDEYMMEFLYKGVPFFFDLAQADAGYAQRARAAWEEFIDRVASSISPRAFNIQMDPDQF